MEIALIRNFLLAMVATLNPLGKIPIWVEASEGCDGPVRTRLALMVTGTATFLLLLFLFFGQSILSFLGLDLPSFRVDGGIIILLIGIEMLRGRAVAARRAFETSWSPCRYRSSPDRGRSRRCSSSESAPTNGPIAYCSADYSSGSCSWSSSCFSRGIAFKRWSDRSFSVFKHASGDCF
jgi:hypothetical protein